MTISPNNYMRQLDGLRAVAVGIVLVHHLISIDSLPIILKYIPYGYMGVRLFFVLSGFLITGILLKGRLAIATGKVSLKHCLRQFYIRRFLRIFPLYYFVIAVTLAIGLEETSTYWLSLITYTFNIEVSLQGWYPAYIAHFWSLSIEEQYYIFWPCVILLTPRRYLIPVTLFLIALAPIYRCIAYLYEFKTISIYTFTFSSLDALGLGSLLAIISMNRDGRLLLNRVLNWKFSLLFLSLAGLLQALLVHGIGWSVFLVFFELFIALFFVWAVWHAATGFTGVGGKILGSGVLVYIGKISYGLYVYHLFAPPVVRVISNSLGFEMEERGPIEFGLSVSITFLVAALSWHLMESPLNNLKRHFPYVSKKEQAEQV